MSDQQNDELETFLITVNQMGTLIILAPTPQAALAYAATMIMIGEAGTSEDEMPSEEEVAAASSQMSEDLQRCELVNVDLDAPRQPITALGASSITPDDPLYDLYYTKETFNRSVTPPLDLSQFSETVMICRCGHAVNIPHQPPETVIQCQHCDVYYWLTFQGENKVQVWATARKRRETPPNFWGADDSKLVLH